MKPCIGLCLIVGWASCLLTSAACWADENVHDITVSRRNAVGIKNFKVVNVEKVAVLNTTPDDPDRFVKGKSKIVASKRHGTTVWMPTEDEASIFTVKSPPIPSDQESWVMCVGAIASSGGGGGRDASQAITNWRSELKPPGVHIIVVMQFSGPDQNPPNEGAPSENARSMLGAEALKKQYEQGGDSVIIVTCGISGSDISSILGLRQYLSSAPCSVVDGSVVSFDSIGHGQGLHNYMLSAGPTKYDDRTNRSRHRGHHRDE